LNEEIHNQEHGGLFPEMTELIPHRPPMVMIDALAACDRESVSCVKVFREGDYGVEGSEVSETLLIEGLAQTIAALNGVAARVQNRPPARGMLVGVTGFEILSAAKPGRELEFSARITTQLGQFTFADGIVKDAGNVIAKGSLKFYVEGQDGESQEAPKA
jgi:predicted hotdog family 3-hydroxylacyl-ACP dehydratase